METPDFRSFFLSTRSTGTFPDSCSGLSTLQRWHTEFNKVFLPWRRRPFLDENVARVKRLVEDNPRMTTRQVAAEASDRGSRALKPPQRARPSPALWSHKTQRVKCCQDLLKLFQDHGEDFLGSHLLVQDESRFYWDLAERRQVWAEPTGARFSTPCQTDSEEDDDSDGVHLQAEAGIDHCTTCRDHNRPEHHDRVPEDDWEDKIRLKDCLLMWGNARPHTSTDTREFLTRRDVKPVKQSPYSPDLNLFDRFLFRKLKHNLREDEFGGHEEATLAVQRAMRRVSEYELYDQLRKLRGHRHDVIAVGGDYVY
ncbi:Uncharacterized protein FKW44_019137 [Caligus rogercresseyi]|uniref:Histone-lysine N-methyltransferase SETMAR n=1 Tax=Caligus rogercresseyi TaxID=217165 RepID=A0A7T8GW24_CALRO|nr:Uncharacterized protein FKW44_019137 [Caligus rogercresseyi]